MDPPSLGAGQLSRKLKGMEPHCPTAARLYPALKQAGLQSFGTRLSNSRYARMAGDAGTKSTLCALAAHVLSCYPHHTVIDVPGPDLPCCIIEEALLACLKQVLGCCRLAQVATFN